MSCAVTRRSRPGGRLYFDTPATGQPKRSMKTNPASANYQIGLSRAVSRKGPPAARTACVTRLLPLLLLFTLPAVAQAQFNYTTNNGTITITGYTGPGGDVHHPQHDQWPAGHQHRGPGVLLLHEPDQRHDPQQRHQHRGLRRSGDCTSLTSVTIPNSVTYHSGTRAFWIPATSLTNVTIAQRRHQHPGRDVSLVTAPA